EQRKIPLVSRNPRPPRRAQHGVAGDAGEAIAAAGRPELALADDEEMRGVAGGDEPAVVEHQRLVRARLHRLDAGEDAVELRMRVELLVLLGGAGAPD